MCNYLKFVLGANLPVTQKRKCDAVNIRLIIRRPTCCRGVIDNT